MKEMGLRSQLSKRFKVTTDASVEILEAGTKYERKRQLLE